MSRAAVLALATALLLLGCAQDVKFRRASTGETAVCKGGYYTWGLIGMAQQTAKQLQERCMDEYVRQGYERVGD